MNKIPKVIAGQSFKLNILLSYFGTADKLDLTTCSDLEVKFICPKHNEEIDMPFEISDGKLKITVDKDTLHVGTYGLEITGEDNSGNYFRFKLKPYEFLMCVDATSEITNENDWETITSLDLNARIGFNLPNTEIELSNYVDKYTFNSEIKKVNDNLDKKQDYLVSSKNIKTINGTSILGQGDVKISSDSLDLSEYGKISYINAEDNKIKQSLDLKVNKEDGKALSSNDYTDDDKTKLSNLNNYDDEELRNLIKLKQDLLVSGSNVKTINGSSILGTGNILVSGNQDLSNYATISYVNEQDLILNSSINNKVDKVAGKSLISDDEITRLSEVHNYDDTKLKSYIDSETSYRMNTDILIVKDLSDEITRAKQAESNINSNIPVNISQLTNDSKYQTQTEVDNRIKAVVGAAPEALDTLEEIAKQMATDESAASSITTNLSNLTTRVTTNESNIANKVDKSEGKSLILDSEITRLSEVHNYDDTLLLSKINQKQDTLVSGSNISTINGKSILEGGNIEVATDLSSYVKSSELSNMSYVTQEQLSANSYLKSYTVPSNYVTQEQLSKNGYISGIPSNYITQEQLTSNSYLKTTGTAANSDKVDNYHIAYVTSLPSSPDSNTIYFIS